MKGYVQVYTGDGKGKTTAAIGITMRALGAGKKVLFLQFMKAKSYSEHDILPGISPNLTLETFGKPFFVAKPGSAWAEELKKMGGDYMIFEPGNPPQEYLDLVAKGVEKAKKAVSSGAYDLVVLDEINCALFFGLIKWEDLLDLIDSKAENTELILTGRGATPELIERADLVTEMREIKHYYMQGVQARKGIEN